MFNAINEYLWSEDQTAETEIDRHIRINYFNLHN